MQRKTKDFEKWSRWLIELEQSLGFPPDLVIRTVLKNFRMPVQIMFFETLTDTAFIEEFVVQPFMQNQYTEDSLPLPNERKFAVEMSISQTPEQDLLKQSVEALLTGKCIVSDFYADRILFLDAYKVPTRSVEEPKAELTVRGPHEGFTENLDVNISLIRKRIPDQSLRFEQMNIGNVSKTPVLLVYCKNIAPKPLVDEARKRLQAIQTDIILESSNIEEYLLDNKWSLFPQLSYTEKPDFAVSHLAKGKVAIMVQGTPNVLLGPVTFFEYFISPEDYYQRADIATFIRWIRFISFFIAVFVPSLYVAATTYHQELIPTQLLINLSAQREGVPLSSLSEVLIMEIIFEIIREAGLRMPRAIGQALSIVGAIVLGQAAVEAGLISAAIVIVVSVTGIANFVVPIYSFGITQRLLRFSFIILAGMMGLFGILCGGIFLIAHLAALKSFGVPYLAPTTPFYLSDWRDLLVRFPMPHIHSKKPKFLNLLKRKG